MARVTPTEVRQLIDTALVDAVLSTYIDASAAIVDQAGVTGSEPLLKEIERWLTAHLLSVTREQQLEQAAAGPASTKFLIKGGLGLNGSTYGQQLLLMDVSGKLAEVINNTSKTKAWIQAI
jgi:hypothetical protein